MISIIIGNKGSGKTKKLIDLVNSTTSQSKGNVICIEKGDTLTYNITHKARLVDIEAYGITNYTEYYAFLKGMCAGNHDVTDIFGDATLRIGGRDYNELAKFIAALSEFAEKSDIKFCFTVSCDESDLPKEIFDNVSVIK